MKRPSARLIAILTVMGSAGVARSQETPAQEPAVKMLEKAIPAVVRITIQGKAPAELWFLEGQTTGTGSGFFVSADGYLLTNHHVIAGAGKNGITITTQDEKEFKARVIGSEEECDLALLKIDSDRRFEFISLEDSSPNMVGQSVFVIGNPHGLGTSVSRGILSARARELTLAGKKYSDLLQTDAAINPGNSGGPILDISGKLVAVSRLTFIGAERRQAQGLNFGMPGNLARIKVEEFKKNMPAAPPASQPAPPPGSKPPAAPASKPATPPASKPAVPISPKR